MKIHDDEGAVAGTGRGDGQAEPVVAASLVAELTGRPLPLKAVLHEGYDEFFVIEAPVAAGAPEGGFAPLEAAIRARMSADQNGHDDACLLVAVRELQQEVRAQTERLTALLAEYTNDNLDPALVGRLTGIAAALSAAVALPDGVEIVRAHF